jgi:hypothetical protein
MGSTSCRTSVSDNEQMKSADEGSRDNGLVFVSHPKIAVLPPRGDCFSERDDPIRQQEPGVAMNGAHRAPRLRLEAGALLGKYGDDPPRGMAGGLDLHDRTDQPGDERSPHRQGCFLAAMLVMAAASRHLWISRLERLHVLPISASRTAFRNHRSDHPVSGINRTRRLSRDLFAMKSCNADPGPRERT